MADFKATVGRILRRCFGPAGWLLLLGVVKVVGVVIVPRSEHRAVPVAEKTPTAQVGRDDYGGDVWALAFSPDGRALASATVQGDVWLKDLASGGSSRIQRGSFSSAQSLAFSQDSRVLAVTGDVAPLRQWDVETGTERDPSEVGEEAPRRVAFSPDGALMAVDTGTGDPARTLVTLHERDGRRVGRLIGHDSRLNVMTFSPGGTVLATGDTSGLVTLWDAATRRARRTVRTNGSSVQALAFSPDGARLATLAWLGRDVEFWDTASGESRGTIRVGASVANAFAFSPDGRTIAVAGTDGLATLWTVGEEARALGSVLDRGRPLHAIAFSPDSRRLATGGADGVVRLWDVAKILNETSRHGR